MEALNTILQHTKQNTNTSDSGSESKSTNTSVKSLREVQLIANRIEAKLGKQVPSRYPLYCKVARELPEHIIENCLEAELNNRAKGKPPHRLFSYLVGQYMK
jgi:hypothetical protein